MGAATKLAEASLSSPCASASTQPVAAACSVRGRGRATGALGVPTHSAGVHPMARDTCAKELDLGKR